MSRRRGYWPHSDPEPAEPARPCVRGCLTARRHVTACPQQACLGCQPRPAEHGQLCYGCHRRLELILTDLPTVLGWLSVHLPRGTSQRLRPQVGHTKADAPPVPIDLEILDLCETITASLAGWCLALVEATSLVGPRDLVFGRHGGDVYADPSTCAGYLLTHLGAVECQPFAAIMWDELAWLTSDAHALAPWRPEARRLVGVPCPECHEAALLIFGGDVDVTCGRCRAMIPAARYGLWCAIVAEEVAG